MKGRPVIQVHREELMLRFGKTMAGVTVRVWKPETPAGTVFCVHGFNGNGNDFEPLAVFLARNGYAVVSPDMLGRGDSAYFRDPKKYSVQNYAKCLSAVVGAYGGGKCCFIGKGWGGVMLLVYLKAAALATARAVLCDVPLVWTLAEDKLMQQAIENKDREFATLAEARTHVLDSGEFSELPPELLERFVGFRIKDWGGKFRLGYDPAVIRSVEHIASSKFDLAPLLSARKAPTLFIHGHQLASTEKLRTKVISAEWPRVSFIEGVTCGGPMHLADLKQILLVYGFLRDTGIGSARS
jgi:pimeloyl-ACP methyl ester carboxylesterase